MLLLEQVEARGGAFAAALAPHTETAWELADQIREQFDAGLIAEPVPESESMRIMRQLGVT